MELAIMIEGQNGLNWPRWQRIARLVENLGFSGLYRSDHFTNGRPPDRDSLELWTSLTWLAANTTRIHFGPLVTPFSFRHPALTARMAAAVDDLSGGRLTLGLGAGWQEREHHLFGFELLSPRERFTRFAEGVQVVQQLLTSDQPVTFDGEYFQLREALLLPRPGRKGGPKILIGGNGVKRTLPLAARYASEWNAIFLKSDQFLQINLQLDELADRFGRQPADITRSMMSGLVFSTDQAGLDAQIARRGGGSLAASELKDRGLLVGMPTEIIDQIGTLAEAGVQRLMLQWLALDDLDGLEALARTVLPQI